MAKSKFLEEFKTFALRGNVLDLAVGVIIGGAFQKIVTSVVNDLIMPLVGLMTGGVNFNDQFLILKLPEGVTASRLPYPWKRLSSWGRPPSITVLLSPP